MIAVSGFDTGRSNVFPDGVDVCSGKVAVGAAASTAVGVAVGFGLGRWD